MPDSEVVETEDKKSSLLGSGLFTKLKIGGAILGLVGLECLMAYFLIPSAQDVVLATERAAQNSTLTEEEAADLSIPMGNKEHVEVDLFKFAITSYQPKTGSTNRVDFHLFATINLEDQDEFNELIIQNANRVREQINVTARSVDSEALTDPSLGLLKRKILEKTNGILGKPLVKTIIFSDYSFIKQ